MTTVDPSPATRACQKCRTITSELLLSSSEYRCPGCGFELAHVDFAPNGTIRGIFGYLLSAGNLVNDRYQVEKVLGKGGFGATYLVEDLKLKGRRRALKEIPELLFDDHEVNLLSQLNHPAIPDIIDRFISSAMIYLVLEFGGSRTLGSHSQALGGPIPLKLVLPWMRQLCDALSYLHSQDPPIIHRDLKPDNILLDDNDRIMLIDFGIAKESESTGPTRTIARAASHGFSPPEQVLGTGTDERSDIYALAATFYFLLTDKIPAAAHERVAGKEIEPPSSLIPNIPPELDRILLSALSLNYNQRPNTIDEMKFVFDDLMETIAAESPITARTTRLGAATGPFSTPRPTAGSTGVRGIRIGPTGSTPLDAKVEKKESKKKTRWPLLAAAAVLIAALAVGTIVWLRGSSTTVKVDKTKTTNNGKPPISTSSGQSGAASSTASAGSALPSPSSTAPTGVGSTPSALQNESAGAGAGGEATAPVPLDHARTKTDVAPGGSGIVGATERPQPQPLTAMPQPKATESTGSSAEEFLRTHRHDQPALTEPEPAPITRHSPKPKTAQKNNAPDTTGGKIIFKPFKTIKTD